jgi:hypothetical protein
VLGVLRSVASRSGATILRSLGLDGGAGLEEGRMVCADATTDNDPGGNGTGVRGVGGAADRSWGAPNG